MPPLPSASFFPLQFSQFLSLHPVFLSLHFCCFFSFVSQSSNFIFLPLFLFLPSPLPPTPSLSCSSGNFTDKSPASSLISSSASRLPPHPPHSNQLRSKPRKMSGWSSGVTGTFCSPAWPGCLWFVLFRLFLCVLWFCYKSTAYRSSLESTICIRVAFSEDGNVVGRWGWGGRRVGRR